MQAPVVAPRLPSEERAREPRPTRYWTGQHASACGESTPRRLNNLHRPTSNSKVLVDVRGWQLGVQLTHNLGRQEGSAMPTWFKIVLVAIVAAIVVGSVWAQVRSSRRSASYQPPRTTDGKPDLGGVWQALNTANYDIQSHPARPALALIPAPPHTGVPGLVRATPTDLPAPAVRPLGAVGAVPAGESVVDGDEIPYC